MSVYTEASRQKGVCPPPTLVSILPSSNSSVIPYLAGHVYAIELILISFGLFIYYPTMPILVKVTPLVYSFIRPISLLSYINSLLCLPYLNK